MACATHFWVSGLAVCDCVCQHAQISSFCGSVPYFQYVVSQICVASLYALCYLHCPWWMAVSHLCIWLLRLCRAVQYMLMSHGIGHNAYWGSVFDDTYHLESDCRQFIAEFWIAHLHICNVAVDHVFRSFVWCLVWVS